MLGFIRNILTLFIVLSPAMLFADAHSLAIPNHGDLLLNMPTGWREIPVNTSIPNPPPAVKFTDPSGQFELLVIVMSSREGDVDFNSPQTIRKVAESEVGRQLKNSKESSIEINDLQGDKVTGVFFTYADGDRSPGSFEYTTQAIVSVGDLRLNAFLLHRQKDVPVRQVALDIVKGASQKPFDPPPRTGKPKTIRVSSPDGHWQIAVSSIGLEVTKDELFPDRKARQVSTIDKETDLTISIFMEPAEMPGDSTVMRDVYWARAKSLQPLMEQVKLKMLGDFATAEYMIPKMRGFTINSKNLNLFIVHEGMWIDVHISKGLSTARDQLLFDQIARSVKFEST